MRISCAFFMALTMVTSRSMIVAEAEPVESLADDDKAFFIASFKEGYDLVFQNGTNQEGDQAVASPSVLGLFDIRNIQDEDKCNMKSMAAAVGLDRIKDKYKEAVKAGKLPPGPWEIPASVEDLAEKLWSWSGGKTIKDTVEKLVNKGIAKGKALEPIKKFVNGALGYASGIEAAIEKTPWVKKGATAVADLAEFLIPGAGELLGMYASSLTFCELWESAEKALEEKKMQEEWQKKIVDDNPDFFGKECILGDECKFGVCTGAMGPGSGGPCGACCCMPSVDYNYCCCKHDAFLPTFV